MERVMTTRIFISYVREDREFVHRIATDLTKRLPDLEIIYDLNLPTGASFADTLLNEIRKADVIIGILSPDYFTSAWAEQERNLAVERILMGASRLIPILMRPCEATGFISSLRYIKFTKDDNYESALTELIWGITGIRPLAALGADPGSAVIDPEHLDPERQRELRAITGAVESFKARPEKGSVEAPLANRSRACFVIMPFGDRLLNEIFEDIVRPAVHTSNTECQRGDDVFGSNVIMEDILKSIKEAGIVVADLTGRNANVFYEVGLCHALGKKVLLLAQSIDDVPFDLRHRRVLLYENTFHGGALLAKKLKANMEVMMNEDAL
jgi:hypothetical protein